MKKKTGARALRSILESAMLEIMYSTPAKAEIETCVITKDVIKGKSGPTLKSLRKSA